MKKGNEIKEEDYNILIDLLKKNYYQLTDEDKKYIWKIHLQTYDLYPIDSYGCSACVSRTLKKLIHEYEDQQIEKEIPDHIRDKNKYKEAAASVKKYMSAIFKTKPENNNES